MDVAAVVIVFVQKVNKHFTAPLFGQAGMKHPACPSIFVTK